MTRKILSPLAFVLILILSACSLFQSQVAPTQGIENEQTLIARSVQETMAADEGNPVTSGTPQDPVPPAGVTVTVSVDTNCRTGPGTDFEILGVLLPGQVAEVVGRSHNSDNWIIKLPSNPAITCWLWAYYAATSGDTASLPVIASPPTPTPQGSYTITSIGTGFCDPNYWFRFQLANNGAVTWESYQVVIYDASNGMSFTDGQNSFLDSSTCFSVAMDVANIPPGMMGYASNVMAHLPYNPIGHGITATFKLCSGDNLTGTCLEKSIAINP